MDSHAWNGVESELAFNKVRHVIDLLNTHPSITILHLMGIVLARGFSGTASLDFYSWLDSEWTKAISALSDNRELMECSPIMLFKFTAIETAEFQSVSWEESIRGARTMVAG
eukprot:gene38221-46443_t